MSRVFCDAMLLIYLLDDNPQFAPRLLELITRCFERGDQLITSYLALGEALAGVPDESEESQEALAALGEIGFRFISFDEECVAPFRTLRKNYGLKGPDAMHLACAAAAETDLFLTGDKEILRKRPLIKGIHFISDFETAPL